MKTNVILKSDDRVLFGHVIKQNTKDGGFLSVSDLQNAYNFARFQNAWSERQIGGIMRGKDFQERCYYILHERGFINLQIHAFMEMVEKEGIVNVLKGLKVWKTSGRGENKSTYCDPYIWVLLAMELNPQIYAKVVIWLTDSLIFNRIMAGTEFTPMMRQISAIIPAPNYSLISRSINEKVFGYHEKEIRNTASQQALQKLADIEKFITQAIKMNAISSEKQLFSVIERYAID